MKKYNISNYVRYKEDQEGFQEYVKKQFEEKKGNEGSN